MDACCAAGRFARSERQRADRPVCAMPSNDRDIAPTSVHTLSGAAPLRRPYRPLPTPALSFHPVSSTLGGNRQEGSHSGRVRWS